MMTLHPGASQYLEGPDVSDEGLAALDRLHNLRVLNLDHTSLTPAGTAGLQQTLPNVKIFGVE